MANTPAVTGANQNWLEKYNAWVDKNFEERPVLSIVTTLALAALSYGAAIALVVLSGFNPYVIVGASILMTATNGYATWMIAKICLLNNNDDEVVAEVPRGVPPPDAR